MLGKMEFKLRLWPTGEALTIYCPSVNEDPLSMCCIYNGEKYSQVTMTVQPITRGLVTVVSMGSGICLITSRSLFKKINNSSHPLSVIAKEDLQ